MNESEDRVTTTDLRPLRQAIHDLADTVDELVGEFDAQSNGQGPPEHARKAREKAHQIKKQTPDPVSETEKIRPPWERGGHNSKQEWLDGK